MSYFIENLAIYNIFIQICKIFENILQNYAKIVGYLLTNVYNKDD